MSDSTSQKDEEIDLGQLFTLIGKGFAKVGAFIRFIFDLIVRILLGSFFFFKRHFLKFAIAGMVGALIGFIIDKSKAPEFEASMVVKPNYGSGRQLYKNIAYYDELIQQKNFELLSETFSITIEEAQTLVSFEIKPVINENYMLSTYDEFLSSIDSTVALNFEYESYTSNFKDYSFSEHEIIVISTINNVATKLEDVIVSGVRGNPFFQKLEESERVIIERNEAYLESSLKEVDTLRHVYTSVLLKESEKENSQGTSINLAANKESTKELTLFEQENRINSEIDNLTRIEVRNIEIINVVSSFQRIGFEKDELINNWMVRISLGFVVGLFIVLVFTGINKKILPENN